MSNEKDPYKKELELQLGEAEWCVTRCLAQLADLESELRTSLDNPGGEAIKQANDWLSNCISLYERNLSLIRAMYLDSGPPKVLTREWLERQPWAALNFPKKVEVPINITREWLEEQHSAAENFQKKTAEAERPQPPAPVTQWWENLVHGDENWDRALEKYQALVPHLLNNGGHRDPTPTEQSFLDAYHKAQTTRIQRISGANRPPVLATMRQAGDPEPGSENSLESRFAKLEEMMAYLISEKQKGND